MARDEACGDCRFIDDAATMKKDAAITSIVFNTSINAHIGMPMSSIYAASKAALSSLIRTLSGELIGRGIRVNAVSPGPIATPLHGKIGMDDATIKGLVAQIPAGRAFRFQAVSVAEAQDELRKFHNLLRTLPDRLRDIESFDLNIEALSDANVAGHAVSAVDAATWQVVSPAELSGSD